jgi:PII-like signaling protein
MTLYLLIALGGALGSVARFWLSGVVANHIGATVLRGTMGFGKSSRLHTSKILRLSYDLPVVIEITDSEDKINAFLPVLDGMISGGLVTLEKVRAIRYLGTARSE